MPQRPHHTDILGRSSRHYLPSLSTPSPLPVRFLVLFGGDSFKAISLKRSQGLLKTHVVPGDPREVCTICSGGHNCPRLEACHLIAELKDEETASEGNLPQVMHLVSDKADTNANSPTPSPQHRTLSWCFGGWGVNSRGYCNKFKFPKRRITHPRYLSSFLSWYFALRSSMWGKSTAGLISFSFPEQKSNWSNPEY